MIFRVFLIVHTFHIHIHFGGALFFMLGQSYEEFYGGMKCHALSHLHEYKKREIYATMRTKRDNETPQFALF